MVGSRLALFNSLFFRILRPRLVGASSRIDSYYQISFFPGGHSCMVRFSLLTTSEGEVFK